MSTPLTPRARQITAQLDLSAPGLEIGPSYNPLVPKSSGVPVQTVDHATREELVDKYRRWGHTDELLDRIDEVDHIWTGGSLVETIGTTHGFGWIIGAHIVEHQVDLVGFLQDCSALLTSEGRAAFAVPDMRQTFDLISPLTTLGMVVDRHLLTGTPFHNPGAVLDAYAHQVRKGGTPAWDLPIPGELTLTHSDWAPSLEAFERAKAQDEYLDIHRWVFTPLSFQILMQELFEVGLTDLRLVGPIAQRGHEFHVTLSRTGPGPSADRIQLYRQLLASQAAAFTAALETDPARPSPVHRTASRGRRWARSLRRVRG